LKINFNIILAFTPRFSTWLFPSGLRTKTLCTPILFSTRGGGGGGGGGGDGGGGGIRRRKGRSYLNNEYRCVVPKSSGKLGRAYCGRCEAYPGIPTETGNEG